MKLANTFSFFFFLPSLGRKTIHLAWEPSFLTDLKADLYDTGFPRGPTLWQHTDNVLLCSPFQTSSQEDCILLLKPGAWKEHKVTKEKLQTRVQYLWHLIWEQVLLPDADRLHGVPSFTKPEMKWRLQGFLGLVGCCQNRILNFSLLSWFPKVLLNGSNTDPI